LGPAQDARDFEVRRESVPAHGREGSGGVALIRTHEHRG
jgi:hypothetical protein